MILNSRPFRKRIISLDKKALYNKTRKLYINDRKNTPMSERKKKTADFTSEGINSLAQDKPVVYKILNKNGKNIYTGSAKRGRVAERIKEHLPGGPHPIPGGAKVKIIQKNSIKEARKSESRIISRTKPRYNIRK